MTAPERPDLAAARATIPAPAGPSSVDMQAAAQRATEQPYVEFDGARWYMKRVPDMFDLGELGEAIEQAEQNPIYALAAINRCLRQWLADYPGIRARFRAKHTETNDSAMDDYMRIATGLFEAVTARPTEAPAGSSDGREPTSTSSKDASPSQPAAWTWAPVAGQGSGTTPG